MTDDRMALVDLLQKSGDADFLRAVAEAVLQVLMSLFSSTANPLSDELRDCRRQGRIFAAVCAWLKRRA